MATSTSSSYHRSLAQKARENFVALASDALAAGRLAVRERLAVLVDEVRTAREMQERRDIWTAYQQRGVAWETATLAAWQKLLHVPAAPARQTASTFELMGDDVVENKIIASRLGQVIADRSAEELADLGARLQQLEGTEEVSTSDVIRPEVLMLTLVEQWAAAGLSRGALALVSDVLQRELATRFLEAYKTVNTFLTQNGITPSTDLRSRVRRTDGGSSPAGAAMRAFNEGGASGFEPSGWAPSGRMPTGAMGGGAGPRGAPTQNGPMRSAASAAEETRMMTVASPLARARRRAQGVMVHLKRVLTDHISDFDKTVQQPISPTLARAIARKQDGGDTDPLYGSVPGTGALDYGRMEVSQVAGHLRERSNQLKKAAATTAEKATIEVVALMFQSILAEERIPPSVRVWFARLQLPVLRVALAEPEFFGTLNHPARQLIDRMGSCVMGFDASAINGSALETEIKRVVQVIEQYPETGRRVFQLVYDEFQQFLSKYLTEKGSTLRVATLAQQVEQKETLAIQYTIELRNMLKELPVREDIREFLFKVWAEVLAMAAVRNGPQHEETIALKKAASELVWAASAKPNRAERARVIQNLPLLLQRLRQGMTLLSLESTVQEAHIKRISDTLADAFMSKTEAIPQARIESMAARLANLEDFVSDDSMGDLPLDNENIEMMLGIDASSIEVIADGGSKPTEAMLAWAQELELGHWFMLDHSNRINQVQFAWRSDRKQLHLFASMDGRSYLIQARRLAAYLQAGLLVPQEEEALTLRATRDALAKLDANPERLLN
ncbi:hypothetical protein RD110_26090 [Rhodoferax koreense]|uniref:Thymidine phosphorylase n=1 Tax=Rhodoferax koreensis TaxID=1842727 RepID=A0A1P8K2T7_9BURK|nr:DUF1631 family protein [Rhodoferax koreense]APW40241.1 hypothetical protein RD110_26090 [Rhodoferax koreense]